MVFRQRRRDFFHRTLIETIDHRNHEIQSSSKKRKEHPVDMLANKTKTELLAEAHSAGIKGRHKMRKDQLILSIRNHLK
jgi:hypothetical protein